MNPGEETPPHDAVGRIIVVNNQRGLHARAAARFVKTAARIDARDTPGWTDSCVSSRCSWSFASVSVASATSVSISCSRSLTRPC